MGVAGKQSALENSRYIAKLYGLDPDYVESFCRWLCNLGEYFEMPIATYSSGMKSRFTFALMLALEFDIYLIDEGMPPPPTSNSTARPAPFCASG